MERRLAAILAADVVAFGRLMGADEVGTLEQLRKVRAECIEKRIAEHHGRIFKLTGDGILAEFPSVVDAVACAAQMQRELRARAGVLEFRIGVNLGDVIVDDGDIYGDGVNVAVRLEGVAPPGGIAVSDVVRAQIGNRLALRFEDRGEQELKNIERAIRVYDVILEEEDAATDAMNPPKDERPSLAILPFTNMSGDPEQEYFSDGITEDIITDLANVSAMRVIARHSAFSYKGKAIKVQQVGQELGVRHLVEGSVRKAGGRVRVTAQLLDCRDGSHVWAERFDRDLTDIFAIQDEITHAIVEQLKVKLLPEEKRSIAQPPTQNIEAYNFYLRGRELSRRRSKRCLQLAREMFVKATALDPNYARAYAGIAICDSFLFMTYHADVSIDGILDLAARALALDDKLVEAHAARAVALSAAARYDEAQAVFEQALGLDPNAAETCYFYARSSVVQGKHERAAEMFERATAADPDDYQSPCLLKMVYNALGRASDAKRAATIGLERAERELARHPDDSRPAQLGAGAAVALGDKERAKELIARALTLDPDDLVAQFNAACVYALIGESDHSLDLLERCLPKLGPEKVKWAKQDSDFESVRDHPRFQKLFDSIADA